MTADIRAAGAASHAAEGWHTINWKSAYRIVCRLQARIVKAIQEGRWGKVKALQYLLTHSFRGKALAIRRVTENQGKGTPGVDREIWDTPEKKATALQTLQQRGYNPQPLRRVYIPKLDFCPFCTHTHQPIRLPRWYNGGVFEAPSRPGEEAIMFALPKAALPLFALGRRGLRAADGQAFAHSDGAGPFSPPDAAQSLICSAHVGGLAPGHPSSYHRVFSRRRLVVVALGPRPGRSHPAPLGPRGLRRGAGRR